MFAFDLLNNTSEQSDKYNEADVYDAINFTVFFFLLLVFLRNK